MKRVDVLLRELENQARQANARDPQSYDLTHSNKTAKVFRELRRPQLHPLAAFLLSTFGPSL